MSVYITYRCKLKITLLVIGLVLIAALFVVCVIVVGLAKDNGSGEMTVFSLRLIITNYN